MSATRLQQRVSGHGSTCGIKMAAQVVSGLLVHLQAAVPCAGLTHGCLLVTPLRPTGLVMAAPRREPTFARLAEAGPQSAQVRLPGAQLSTTQQLAVRPRNGRQPFTGPLRGQGLASPATCQGSREACASDKSYSAWY